MADEKLSERDAPVLTGSGVLQPLANAVPAAFEKRDLVTHVNSPADP